MYVNMQALCIYYIAGVDRLLDLISSVFLITEIIVVPLDRAWVNVTLRGTMIRCERQSDRLKWSSDVYLTTFATLPIWAPISTLPLPMITITLNKEELETTSFFVALVFLFAEG